MKLQGKVAFITGAASGFGKEFTLHLLRNNCKVRVFFSGVLGTLSNTYDGAFLQK